MQGIELPHSADCLVCGRVNPRGLKLSFHVDPIDGFVRTRFISDATLCGFADIVHGGALAMIFDEAMVWAANWARRRFCVCGELNVRFVKSATAGQTYLVTARIEAARSRLLAAVASMTDEGGELVASASGKYLPLPTTMNTKMFETMLREPTTAAALAHFTEATNAG